MVGRGELREPVRRLLLVEDDPGDAFLVGELIAEVDPDLALTVAGSMPEALAAARRTSDCVLLDLNLPGYAGLDGLRTLLGGRSARRRLRPHRPRRRAPRHRRRRRGRPGLPGQGQGRRPAADPRHPLRRRAPPRGDEPAAAAGGAARGGRVQPGSNAGCCPRRCWRAATCTPSRSTAPAAPARCWAATSSTPSATPTAPCTRSSATSPATDPTRPRSVRSCGCRGARSCSPGWARSGCCRSCSGCWSANATTAGCSPPRA